jgi:uncharacterized protein YciI
MELEIFYLVLIKKGPRWTPEETPELERLQEAHLAHINQLHEQGSLVAAGPIDDGSELRGISVLRTESLEMAVALAEADPSVRAGRLTVEVHPWYLPAGVFPS